MEESGVFHIFVIHQHRAQPGLNPGPLAPEARTYKKNSLFTQLYLLLKTAIYR